jgi:hypothetical protein
VGGRNGATGDGGRDTESKLENAKRALRAVHGRREKAARSEIKTRLVKTPEKMTVDEAIEKIEALSEVYGELEATPLPTTLDEAVKSRFEISVAVAELAGFTAYAKRDQEADATRAVSLSSIYRVIREMEEEMIRKVVLKPTLIAEQAFWSNTLGMKKKVWDFGGVVIEGVKQILTHPAAAREAIWIALSNLALLKFVGVLDAIAIPEIAKAFFHGMQMRESAVKRLREKVLPQRSGKRYRVKRKSRKK